MLHSCWLRIITYNLWRTHGAWENRRPVLVNGLCALQPDIVALQEAIVRDGYDQVMDVLGADYYVAHQSLRGDDGQGTQLRAAGRLRTCENWICLLHHALDRGRAPFGQPALTRTEGRGLRAEGYSFTQSSVLNPQP
jgi:hypothetical protein